MKFHRLLITFVKSGAMKENSYGVRFP